MEGGESFNGVKRASTVREIVLSYASMTLERLSETNLQYMAAMVSELWPDNSFDEALTECRSMLYSDKDTCLLIRDGETYPAFIHVSVRSDYVEGAEIMPVAYIEGLYVTSSHRGSGLGKMLIQAAETWARQKGCTQLASDTELTNTDGIAFHLHNGFEEVNRIVCFIKNLSV